MKKRSFLNARKVLEASVVLAAFAAVGTAACGDSNDSASDTSQADKDRETARTYYLQRVHPLMGTCIGCHVGTSGPKFMAENADESYGLLEKTSGLIASPKSSPLVQYQHRDAAIVVSPEQRTALTQWLGFEATARGLEGAIAKPKTVTEAYKQFADCMNFDVWSYYRMGDLAFAQTDSEGPCLGCHSTGQGSAWLSAGSREVFEKAQQFPYIQKFVVGKLDASGSFESLQPSNRLIEKANEDCAPEATSCHPRFGLPPNLRSSVRGFVDTTLQNLATGTCGAGIVVPQSDGGTKDAGDGG